MIESEPLLFREETERVISTLKSNKAEGLENFIIEYFKYGLWLESIKFFFQQDNADTKY